MPFIKVNNCNYFYEITGSGDETIVFSHGLLWSSKMFAKQVDFFKDTCRIICYDHRGQGQSELTESGYDMDQLYEDAAALIEQLTNGPVHFAGLSMGGFVGLRLAARRPDLVRSLILMETTALPEVNVAKYTVLNWIVKLFGVKPVANRVMNIMFGQKFLSDEKRKAEYSALKNELLSLDKSIVKAVSGVIKRKGVEKELDQIECPVLILCGTQDIATTPDKSEYMAKNIKNAQLVMIEGGGHTANIEEAEQYNDTLDSFLTSLRNTRS